MDSSRSTYIQPINPRLQFGVELREIYPPWYLHPTLKNLIYLAETNIRSRHGTRFKTDQLFGKGCNGEGSIKQRLCLKKRVMQGKNILELNIAAGVPLWLLRHFLGLLPTPIFPPKSDEYYWYNLSVTYYESFIENVRKRTADIDVLDTVAFELSHLPARNLTFLFELFEMIRFLSMKSSVEDIVDKNAILILVRYFTPSLIERPYRPGNLTKNDKKYFAFILFSVYFWPELRSKIHDLITSRAKNPEKFHYYPEMYDKYASSWYNDIYLKDIGVQTDSDCLQELFSQIETSSAESSVKNYPRSSEKIFNSLQTSEDKMVLSTTTQNIKSQIFEEEISKSISTQTEHQKGPEYPKFSVKINSRIRNNKPLKRKTDNDIIILQIPRGHHLNPLKNVKIVSYRKNKEKILKTDKKIVEKQQESYCPENSKSVTYGWKIDSKISDKGEFLYDSFIGQTFESTPTPFRSKKLFSSYDLTNTPSSNLPEKVTKYGWTYNNLNFVADPYKLCYDIQKSCNSLTSETLLTEKIKKKKYSFMNFSSKITFLKKFTTQSKRSISCHDLNSTVKYKKISKSNSI